MVSKVLDKQDVMLLAQLLNTMQEMTKKLEEAYKKGDAASLNSTKKKFLELQERAQQILK